MWPDSIIASWLIGYCRTPIGVASVFSPITTGETLTTIPMPPVSAHALGKALNQFVGLAPPLALCLCGISILPQAAGLRLRRCEIPNLLSALLG